MTDRKVSQVIRRAGGTEQQAVLDILTEAFMDDPVMRWLFPDEGDRRRLQPLFHGAMLTRSNHEAYLIGQFDGASIWMTLAAGQSPFPEPPETPGPDLAATFGDNAGRLWELGPTGQAHLYLPSMGVVPGRQGSGLGSAMLRHQLDRTDNGLPAYLDASSPRNRAFYLRHGFDDLGEPVHLPDGPRIWPMWRQPQEQLDNEKIREEKATHMTKTREVVAGGAGQFMTVYHLTVSGQPGRDRPGTRQGDQRPLRMEAGARRPDGQPGPPGLVPAPLAAAPRPHGGCRRSGRRAAGPRRRPPGRSGLVAHRLRLFGDLVWRLDRHRRAQPDGAQVRLLHRGKSSPLKNMRRLRLAAG
jgi:GNAT superfamily N-acetyltransferase